MPEPFKIRSTVPADLVSIAEVHLAAFPQSALTALGADAVRRYYDWQLTGPHEVSALCAFAQDRLAGFCFGGVFRGAMIGFLRKNRGYLALRVATHPWLAFNPLFRERLILGVNVLRRFSKPKVDVVRNQKPAPKVFGVLSIGVLPRFQGLGLGKLLMEAAEGEARVQGFREMQLSVNPDNRQAIGFYEGLGWNRAPGGDRWAGEMRKSLPAAEQIK